MDSISCTDAHFLPIECGGRYVDCMGRKWQCVAVDNHTCDGPAVLEPWPPLERGAPRIRRWVDPVSGRWSPYPTLADLARGFTAQDLA